MTRAQVREFAPYLGLASLVVGVVAFVAALLGVTLSGPGQRLNALEPRVDSVIRAVQTQQQLDGAIIRGLGRGECARDWNMAIQREIPCADLLRGYLRDGLRLP